MAEAIDAIKSLLEIEEDSGLMLGDTGFYVESIWLPNVQKYHVAVRDLEKGYGWVASIVFDGCLAMSVEEVKRTLRSLGVSEYSLCSLGVTNEVTVGELLAGLKENVVKAGSEEWIKKVDVVTASFLEECLEKGVLRLNDGLLNAVRKIEGVS